MATGTFGRYFTPRGKALEWITKIHRGLYRATGGVLGSLVFQRAEAGDRWPLRPMHILLLTTTGRKSGQQRTVPLPYFTYEGRTLVVGSFAGGDKHPAWFLNLQSEPAVTMQIGRTVTPATAIELAGQDRDRLWAQLTADWPRYALYQQGTPRTIPLVEMVPAPGEA
jgi:deazaflavin-dependent oxidoreductase (nitroreductase family)